MAIASRKACPVVLRRNQDRFEILAFRHPIAGCQLVKGSIEPEEDVGQAALRELCEESGVCDAGIASFLGHEPGNRTRPGMASACLFDRHATRHVDASFR
jgi:8-oxo-dGTP pyrophosphatase MutT (NUDIX family)